MPKKTCRIIHDLRHFPSQWAIQTHVILPGTSTELHHNNRFCCSTPLMEAAQEGHLELVKYLIKSQANVNAQTGTGDTALTYACENGHTDVADVLLQHGAELVSVPVVYTGEELASVSVTSHLGFWPVSIRD